MNYQMILFTAVNLKIANVKIIEIENNQFNYKYSTAAGYRAIRNISVWQDLSTAVASVGIVPAVTHATQKEEANQSHSTLVHLAHGPKADTRLVLQRSRSNARHMT